MVFDRIGLVRKLISSYLVTIQYRSKHLLPRPYENDSVMQNPIAKPNWNGFCIVTVKVLNSYLI